MSSEFSYHGLCHPFQTRSCGGEYVKTNQDVWERFPKCLIDIHEIIRVGWQFWETIPSSSVPLFAQHLGYARVCEMATPVLQKTSSYLRLTKFMGCFPWNFLKKKYYCFTKRNENSSCSLLCAATIYDHIESCPIEDHPSRPMCKPSVQYRLDQA